MCCNSVCDGKSRGPVWVLLSLRKLKMIVKLDDAQEATPIL